MVSLNPPWYWQMKRIEHAAPSLPNAVIHSRVIPEILSEHLHLLLTGSVAPTWHAFYTLPLVSFAFRRTCRSLCASIFGLEDGEDESVINDVLSFAQTLWTQAKRPPQISRPVFEYSHVQLMRSNSLIRVYMCIALAKWYLNFDVLRYIVQADRILEFSAWEEVSVVVDDLWQEDQVGEELWRDRMPDKTMHRLFLPLTCAMKLCDMIRPARLAYRAAEYLADIVPLLCTVPVMLKYSQDLQSYISRKHIIEVETWIKWTYQTLGLIEDTELLVKQLQGTGKLVGSFTRSSSIPWEVLEVTDIINVLREVSCTDWGVYSGEISERANAILSRWN